MPAWGQGCWRCMPTPPSKTSKPLKFRIVVPCCFWPPPWRTPGWQGLALLFMSRLFPGPIAVGDELVVRIELRTDRDMEFVHLKDQRGSGTEPVNVLSRYKYQDGLAYYESTRDTASHFFIDYLPKGTYVFEYSTRVQLKGAYQTGIAEIQCMYAPEFNSHSESLPLVVK